MSSLPKHMYDDVVESFSLLCDVEKDSLVIDLGCGDDYFISLLRKKGFSNCVGCDSHPVRNGVVFLNLNKDLIFGDERVRLFTAFEVTEHLENLHHFFREVSRCLRPGGYLIMTRPNNQKLFRGLEVREDNDHENIMSDALLNKLCKRNGLKIVSQTGSPSIIPFLRIKLPPNRAFSDWWQWTIQKRGREDENIKN